MNDEKQGVLHRKNPDYPNTWQLSAGRSFTGVAPQLSPYLLQSRERKEDVVFVFEKGKPANIRAADPQKEAQSDRLAEEREAERAERQAEIAAKNAIATSERRSTDAAVGAKRANDTLLKTPRRSGPRDFRNPYNFVPAPEPPEDRKATALDRGAPVALDRWHKKLWSGCIRLRLTAATPLLLPEAPAVEETDGHKTFRTRREIRDDAEYPVLPVTSLKGVLRAACEAVTNSRFGAFDEHDRELGRRMPAEDGLRMVPARVTEGGLDLFMGPHGDSA